MSEKAKLRVSTGFIGLFDVLGYQVFLENNSPEVAANHIQNSLNCVHKNTAADLLRFIQQLGPETEDLMKQAVVQTQSLVFSDTILLTLPRDSAPSPTTCVLFLFQCAVLWVKMFDYGLPLRGAIHYGEFLMQGNCFAGKPIIDAYKATAGLNFAGCVVTDEAAAIVAQDFREPEVLMFPYAVPLRDGTFRKTHILNLGGGTPSNESYWSDLPDLRQTVHEAFWKHGKDVTAGVSTKIDETERMLRFIAMKHPGKRGKRTGDK